MLTWYYHIHAVLLNLVKSSIAVRLVSYQCLGFSFLPPTHHTATFTSDLDEQIFFH